MRCDRATRLLVVAIGTLAILTAQTKIDLSSQARRIDFSNAPAVKPIPVGSALPATCGLGEMFFKRDANAGENLYVCPAQNIWTQISGTATSLHPGTAGGILISNTAANFDVDADTMFLASQAGNNVFTGHNDFSGAASLRIVTGSVEPPADGCDTSSEAGSMYMLTGDSAKASLLYVCQAASDEYNWRPATYAYDTVAPPHALLASLSIPTPPLDRTGSVAQRRTPGLSSAARQDPRSGNESSSQLRGWRRLLRYRRHAWTELARLHSGEHLDPPRQRGKILCSGNESSSHLRGWRCLLRYRCHAWTELARLHSGEHLDPPRQCSKILRSGNDPSSQLRNRRGLLRYRCHAWTELARLHGNQYVDRTWSCSNIVCSRNNTTHELRDRRRLLRY